MDKLSILTVLAVIAIATEVSSQGPRPRRPSGRRTSSDAIRLGSDFRAGRSPRCTTNIRCSRVVADSPYRTADGSCNNLENPEWGKTLIPMRRFIKAKYDGVPPTFAPRGSLENILPKARYVSRMMHETDVDQDDATGVTHLLMQWGQFLDHDITLTSLQEEDNGNGQSTPYSCCKDDFIEGFSTAGMDNLAICFPIVLDEGETHFTERECLDFVRSLQTSDAKCKGIAEQVNQITAYIDASNVYGTSEEEIEILRGGDNSDGGYMAHAAGLLPKNSDNSVCNTENGHYCFHAGDERVNEQPGLTSLHTIWMKEHNRIAKILTQETGWDAEKVFDETRKIVGAMMQQITYGEFLPLVLGKREMDKYGLNLDPSGHRSNTFYKPQVDASIHNAFATAAYRFGHSLVRQFFKMVETPETTETKSLKDMFSETSIIQDNPDNVERILRGLATENAENGDRFINPDLTGHLFQVSDLAALNIQRGRDHGLPGYLEFRRHCKLPVPNDKNDFLENFNDIDGKAAMILAMVYNDKLEDIDLFTAGLAEKRVPGGLVGPTFACLLGQQFQKLMTGDRFWFELPGRTGFRPEQLAEIRKVTLARVLCDVANIQEIQPEVFKTVTVGNAKVDCTDTVNIPEPDFRKWKVTNSQRPARPGRRRP